MTRALTKYAGRYARSVAREFDAVRTYVQEMRRWRAVGSLTTYPKWRESIRGATALDDEAPWIVFAARRRLEQYLRPHMRVFEWGSGGSTLFFARRAASVVTIEHDGSWGNCVSARLRAANIHNADVRVLEPEAAAVNEPLDSSAPDSYASADPQHARRTFIAYATAIDEFADASFDVVVVDGRARASCLKHAMSKVRSGGLLLLDNSERDEYAHAATLPGRDQWRHTEMAGAGPYNTYFWKTTIWSRR